MVSLNKNGEVCDLLDVSQFVAGKSAYECVAYSAALVKYAGLPGKGPTGTAIQASNLAQYWYGKLEGGNDAANKNGMSTEAEDTMLGGMGLHYAQEIASLQAVKVALNDGYPVLLCGAEAGFYDVLLGDHVPYNWPPSGNHCIVVSGVTKDGNLLVHDCANVDSAGRIRPGPRPYDASKLQFVSVTSVRLPVPVLHLPANWSDDGHTLTCPTGEAVLGFRTHILPRLLDGSWEAGDFLVGKQFYNPRLELSNAELGGGDQLLTYKHALAYPHNPTGGAASLKETVIEEYVGKELDACRRALQEEYTKRKAVEAQVAALQAQLAQGSITPQEDALVRRFIADARQIGIS